MHKIQYDTLRADLGLGDFAATRDDQHTMLYITSGRQKGKLGRLLRVSFGSVTVQVPDQSPISLPYTKVYPVDGAGAPIQVTALDITGRPITGTSVVCYSVLEGPSSHALEIGRVVKTNPSGSLTVQPIIHNGRRIEAGIGRKACLRSQIKAARVIVLPVEPSLVMTWLLSGFEVYQPVDLP